MKILFLILLTIDTYAQCRATIDSTTDNFCLSALANKTFLNASASGGTINWISSGSGVFDNNTLQKPRYVPSADDRTRGYVFIYLDVWREGVCSVLPAVTLNFTTMKAVSRPATQSICSGLPIRTIVLSTALRHTTFRWSRNNTTAVTGMASSGTGNITGTLINKTQLPVIVTFTITPVTSGCTGTPTTCTVTVNPCLFTKL
jgi:hypothetical protein